MKNILRRTLGLFVVGTLTGPAQAVTSTAPYYAEPSWDQKLACTTPATCPRFIVLTDWNSEAVLDRETGLVWEQAPATITLTWFQAINHCTPREVGGRKGWHLPLIEQLASLVDSSNSNPALPTGHPFTNVNVQDVRYWSASTHASGNPSFAWFVYFSSGSPNIELKTVTMHPWCVRGGQSFD